MLDSVLGYMDDDNAEGKLRQVVLKFESAIDGQKNVDPAAGESDELMVRNRSPFHLRRCNDLVIGECNPYARIYAFIYKDPHLSGYALDQMVFCQFEEPDRLFARNRREIAEEHLQGVAVLDVIE